MLPRSGETDGERPPTWRVLLGPSVCWGACPWLRFSLGVSLPGATFVRDGEGVLCPKEESDCSGLLDVLKHMKMHIE